jgi:DNA end-binding protein Ku
MPRSMWSGSISFGLLNVPVKVATAVSKKQVRFHLLHDDDGVRLESKRVCPQDGQEVPWEHVDKGYEVSKGEYVVFTKEELESLEAESNHAIELEDFVDPKEIDPLFFDSAYYLVPEERSAKAYRLLLDAMTAAKRVGIARVVMRGKESLVTVRPHGDVLLMETMNFADEIVPSSRVMDEIPKSAKPAEKELAMARQIIETLSGPFEPKKYKDEHRERLLKAIEKKADGKEVTAPRAPKARKEPKDLLKALEESLAQVRKKGKKG